MRCGNGIWDCVYSFLLSFFLKNKWNWTNRYILVLIYLINGGFDGINSEVVEIDVPEALEMNHDV